MPTWESAALGSINGLPDGLRFVLVPVVALGAALAVGVAALAFVALGGRRMAAFVAAAGYGAYLIARVAKLFVGRARPGRLLADITIRDDVGGLGFPSGHSAVSMAVVLAVFPYVAWRWRWVLLAIPLTVGLARVYVGAHLPLDVVGGWGIGAFAASVVHLVGGVPNGTRARTPLSGDARRRSRRPSAARHVADDDALH